MFSHLTRRPLSLRKEHINKFSHAVGILDHGAPVGDLNVSPPAQRFEEHEEITDAMPFIFVIIAQRLSGAHGQWGSGFTDQLFRALIKTDNRVQRVIGFMVQFQHILHGTNKIGVCLRRNHPLLVLPRLEFVFLSTWRTVS